MSDHRPAGRFAHLASSPFSNLGRRRPAGAKKADTPAPDPDELDPDAEDEDEDDTEAKKKARKARKAEEEKEDTQDDGDPDAQAARARERSRVTAILTSEPSKANPSAAVYLATQTAMPRAKAIGALAALTGAEEPVPTRATRPAGAQERPMSATAQQIIAAGKKARGEI